MSDKQSIISFIPKGKANAMHLETLAAILEKPVYTVKNMIKRARKDNIILSASCGYWIPESRAELESWLKMMDGQAKSRFSTTKHAREKLKEYPEQITFENVGRESGVK